MKSNCGISPTKSSAALVIALLCCSRSVPHAAAQNQPPSPSPHLVELKAFLFHNSGVIGARDVSETSRSPETVPEEVVNAMLGANSENGPADSVLIVVHVQSSAAQARRGRGRLRFVARSKGRRVAADTVLATSIGLPAQNGLVGIPFVVHQTGCYPLELEAVLTWNGKTSSIRKFIPSRCED